MPEYVFVCPECTQSIEVNREMKRAILDGGCPVCTAQIGAEDFEELEQEEDDSPRET